MVKELDLEINPEKCELISDNEMMLLQTKMKMVMK